MNHASVSCLRRARGANVAAARHCRWRHPSLLWYKNNASRTGLLKMPAEYDNPLKAPILAVLRQHPAGLSEHELICQLRARADSPPLGDGASDVALFRTHFVVMNALYGLQKDVFVDGDYLEISPLLIRLSPASMGNDETELVNHADAGLRDYYLDWRNFHDTGEAEVEALLNTFWARYLAADRRLEALHTLELAPEASWSAVQRAYRRLAARHHPDRGGDQDRFVSIREAYEILARCYK
jgi:hypothetical protein